MAGARDIRRLAFQALFQLDAQETRRDRSSSATGSTADQTVALRAWLEDADHGTEFTATEKQTALDTAVAAFDGRVAADAALLALAPTWPSHRLAAADRAILRLGYHEMHAGKVNPKIVVNDAIELAKQFSTDRSPSFINGVLDKILKQVLRQNEAAKEAPSGPGETVSPPTSPEIPAEPEV